MQSLLHTRAGQALHCAQAAALETLDRQWHMAALWL
jgi:hypothetical protein